MFHRLEEGDQGLTGALHAKVGLTVKPNLGHLPREEDYQIMPATKGHVTNAASQNATRASSTASA
jgi:hypothetical protein